MTSCVEHKLEKQKQRYDQHTMVCQFVPDETVFVRNFGEGDTWLDGEIVNAPGPRSYNVKLSDNSIVRCHADHIHHRSVNSPEQNIDNDFNDTVPIIVQGAIPADNVASPEVVPFRYSTRISRPPNRLLDNI